MKKNGFAPVIIILIIAILGIVGYSGYKNFISRPKNLEDVLKTNCEIEEYKQFKENKTLDVKAYKGVIDKNKIPFNFPQELGNISYKCGGDMGQGYIEGSSGEYTVLVMSPRSKYDERAYEGFSFLATVSEGQIIQPDDEVEMSILLWETYGAFTSEAIPLLVGKRTLISSNLGEIRLIVYKEPFSGDDQEFFEFAKKYSKFIKELNDYQIDSSSNLERGIIENYFKNEQLSKYNEVVKLRKILLSVSEKY